MPEADAVPFTQHAQVLHITPVERALLQLLANGTATREIAVRFCVAEREVDEQLTTLCARMGASSRAEAVAAAFRRGLVGRVDLSDATTSKASQ
jgi:DNA-binding NarL/FixJ family response regulator